MRRECVGGRLVSMVEQVRFGRNGEGGWGLQEICRIYGGNWMGRDEYSGVLEFKWWAGGVCGG